MESWSSVALDTERPLLVVTAKASLDEIDFRSVPDNCVIFRDGLFPEEDHYWVGPRVDAWFVPPRSSALRAAGHHSCHSNYSIGCIVTDLAVAQRQSTFDESQLQNLPPLIDHNEIFISNPALATMFTNCSSQPSALVLMVATGLALGFRHILIIDGHTDLHWMSLIKQARLAESALDLGLRPNARRPYSYDIGQLRALANLFPDASILDASSSKTLRRFIPPADQAPANALAPIPKRSSHHPDPRFFQLIDEENGRSRKCAYVTLFNSDGYMWGAIALANSLMQFTSIPLIALVPTTYNLPATAHLPENMVVVRAPQIRNPNTPRPNQSRFAFTYSKLAVFSLTFLDRAVYLDADTIVLQNIDDLFNGDAFRAVPDMGFTLFKDTFNAGVFAYTPSAELFTDMLAHIENTPSSDSGDQGFLNSYLPQVDWLDHTYNALWRQLAVHPGLAELDSIKVLHFVGPKPWDADRGDLWPSLVNLWLDKLGPSHSAKYLAWREALPQRVTSQAATTPTKQETTAQAATTPTKQETTAQAATTPTSLALTKSVKPKLTTWRDALAALTSGNLDEAERIALKNLERAPDSVRNMRILIRIAWTRHRYGQWTRYSTRLLVTGCRRLLKRG